MSIILPSINLWVKFLSYQNNTGKALNLLHCICLCVVYLPSCVDVYVRVLNPRGFLHIHVRALTNKK